MFKQLVTLFVALFFLGCSVKSLNATEREQKIQGLREMLVRLSPTVERAEAMEMAKSTVLYSQKLAKDYELVSPPLWQNTLVNFGFKKRGLCYHWAEDLNVFLKKKAYKSLWIHEVVASQGNYFEHNALAVSAKSRGIENAILLDAWRNSGNLYFIKINRDKKYQWTERLR
jgi:hypothetical protein